MFLLLLLLLLLLLNFDNKFAKKPLPTSCCRNVVLFVCVFFFIRHILHGIMCVFVFIP